MGDGGQAVKSNKLCLWLQDLFLSLLCLPEGRRSLPGPWVPPALQPQGGRGALPPALKSTGVWLSHSWRLGAPVNAHAGRAGLHRVSLGLGDGQQFSVHSVFPVCRAWRDSL